jgi:PAS domain S-box-containing protein
MPEVFMRFFSSEGLEDFWMERRPSYEELKQKVKKLEERAALQARMVEELGESEEKYRAVFEMAKDGIFVSDETGRFVNVNPAACESLGYTREELLKLSNREIDAGSEGYEAFKKVRDGLAEKIIFQVSQKRKDGTLLPVEITGNFLTVRGRRIAVAVARDMSWRREVEKAFHDSEERYRDIFDNAPVGVFQSTPSGKYLNVNREFARTLGYDTAEELIRGVHNIADLYVDPYDRDQVKELLREHGSLNGYEIYLKRRDGDKVWMSIYVRAVYDKSGKIEYYDGFTIDVTERKRAEEKLTLEKRHLESLIEHSGLAIVVLDGKHNIISFNKDFEKLFQYKEAEIAGRNLDDVIAGEECIKDARSYTMESFKGNAIHGTGKRRRKDGSLIDTEFFGVPVIIDGGIVGAYGIYMDISELKCTEEALRESEDRFRTLAEDAPFGISIMNFDTQFEYFNPEFTEIFGYTREDLPDKEAWFRKAYPDEDYRNRVGSTWKEDTAESFVDGGTKPRIFTVRCRDGQDKIIQFRAVPYKDRGQFMTYVDITEQTRVEKALRASEEKYRTILESIEDGYYETDTAGNFTFLNDSLCGIFGYPADELKGMNYRHNTDKKSSDRIYRMFNTVFRSGIPIKGFEHPVMRKDGKKRRVEVSTTLIRDPGGRPTGFRGITRDITERKQLESRLHQAQKMESLGLMAGGIAHDLNNILSGIVGYPDLLLMELPEDSPLRRPIMSLKDSGQRAADVVSDLLTVARGIATSKEAANLNTLALEYLESGEHNNLQIMHPYVTFETDLDPELLNIRCSPFHIKKIFMNLVTNASEAVRERGHVTMSTKNYYLDEPLKGYEDIRIGEYVMLSVTDNGSGISPDDLDRIFEPFYTKKEMGRSGTGLGLSVVWNTVQDHDGYINVRSDDKGTVFELYFPVTREEVPGMEEKVFVKDYLARGESILVVDDEESQREFVCGLMAKLGYSTEAVSSGEEAIEYLKKRTVDLIILDMIMPKGINGRKTYEKIIKRHPGQKAIIMSGFAETDDVKKAQRLGAGKYIKKPFTMEKIGLAVREELER